MLLKNFGICILFFFLTFSAQAQYELSGQVKDAKTNEFLPGATVYLKGSQKFAATDLNGRFVFDDLEAGKYFISVSFVGYNDFQDTLILSKDTKKVISLHQSVFLTDEVIIKATRVNHDAPTTFTNISSKEIKTINTTKDIPYVFQLTPSVVTTSDAGHGIGYTHFRIRGTDMNRINVTLNGIPLNDAESHGVWWVNMPDLSASVEDIQIQRGVGSSTNGTAAFGASINIKTTKLNIEPAFETSSQYGSFNTWRNSASFSTGLLKNNWAFDGRLSKITTDGYIDRAFSDLKSLFLTGGYYSDKTIFKLNLISGKEKSYQAWMGVPKASLDTNRTYNPYHYSNQTDNYQQDHYQCFLSHQITKHLIANTTLHYTYGRGYFEEYQSINDPYAETAFHQYGLDSLYIIGSDTLSNTDLIRRKWLDNDYYSGIFSINYKKKKHDIIYGSSFHHYTGRHFGRIIWAEFANGNSPDNNYYKNKGIKQNINTFIKWNFKLTDPLVFMLDLQFRYIDYKIKGKHEDQGMLDLQKIYRFFNPKTGFTYNFNTYHKVYASMAVAQREPNRSNFVDAGQEDVPKPEILYDYEAGYRAEFQNARLVTALYYMDYTDQLILTGEVNNVGAYIMKNTPDSYRCGIELSGSYKPREFFEWQLNLTLSKNKIKDYVDYVDQYDAAGNWLPQKKVHYNETSLAFSPEIIAKNQFSINAWKGFQINTNTQYVGNQYIDNTQSNSRSIDPYLITNLNLSQSFYPSQIKEIIMSVYINNLFNHEYENNAWVYKYYYAGELYEDFGFFPQAGIHFAGGITLKL